jgi:hypothetical protein
MLAMAPVQQGQWCHCDNGKDACAMTMVMMPSWQGQQYQLDDDNDDIATRATTLLWWWQRCLDCKDTCTLTMTTPLQWGWRRQLNDSEEASTLMMATTPLLQRRQRPLHIKNGNDFIMTIAKTPATINNFIMALVAQPNSQDACGIGSHAFAALGWVEGWFGINWVEIHWSPLNQFHLDSFLRFYPPKLPLSFVSSSPNCPH